MSKTVEFTYQAFNRLTKEYEDLGTFTRPARKDVDQRRVLEYSNFFWCQHCGEVFGRLKATPSDGWNPVMGVCDQCPHRGGTAAPPPGSMLFYHGLSPDSLAYLPHEFLRREFDLHMKHALKCYPKDIV